MLTKFTNYLKKVNVFLSLLLLVLGLYLIASPFLPKTGFIANAKEFISDEILNVERNKLKIDSIGVNGAIHEGSESELNYGFWRRPNSGTPELGSNTVIAAHRFLYTYGPNTFFNLDKINLESEIEVIWEGKSYKYKVTEIKKVKSNDIGIEAPTKESILTLYTCTSLWDQSKRLVVVAKLVN